jgi:hypothetical protein
LSDKDSEQDFVGRSNTRKSTGTGVGGQGNDLFKENQNKFKSSFNREDMKDIKETLSERTYKIFYMNIEKAQKEDYMEVLKWIKVNKIEGGMDKDKIDDEISDDSEDEDKDG